MTYWIPLNSTTTPVHPSTQLQDHTRPSLNTAPGPHPSTSQHSSMTTRTRRIITVLGLSAPSHPSMLTPSNRCCLTSLIAPGPTRSTPDICRTQPTTQYQQHFVTHIHTSTPMFTLFVLMPNCDEILPSTLMIFAQPQTQIS